MPNIKQRLIYMLIAYECENLVLEENQDFDEFLVGYKSILYEEEIIKGGKCDRNRWVLALEFMQNGRYTTSRRSSTERLISVWPEAIKMAVKR